MANYYIALETRSHAFLLERRMKDMGIQCELTFMPREIMKDLCNMGIRFNENEYERSVYVISHAGLPGCKLYKEVVSPYGFQYIEEKI